MTNFLQIDIYLCIFFFFCVCHHFVSYLEVSNHDESSRTDPARGKTCHIEDTVLVLLNDLGIAEQHNHHNCGGKKEMKVSPVIALLNELQHLKKKERRKGTNYSFVDF